MPDFITFSELMNRQFEINGYDLSAIQENASPELRAVLTSIESGSIYQQIQAVAEADDPIGSSGKTLLLYAGDGSNLNVAQALTDHSDLYYSVADTVYGQSRLALRQVLVDSAEYQALSAVEKQAVLNVFNDALIDDYSQRAARAADNVAIEVTQDSRANSTLRLIEIPQLRSGITLEGKALDAGLLGDVDAIEQIGKEATAERLTIAQSYAAHEGISVSEAYSALDLFKGVDPEKGTLWGRTVDFWKTLGADESGRLTISILNKATETQVLGETVEQAGKSVLDDALKAVEDYSRGISERFSDAARDPVGAGLGELIGLGYVGILGINSVITAEKEGAWVGALDLAIGGAALVVGGLAFEGVLTIAAAAPIAATAVELLGLGAGFYGLVNETDHLISVLEGTAEPRSIGTTIKSFFSPSDDAVDPTPHSTLGGNQVFLLGENAIVGPITNPFSDGNDLVQVALTREIDTGAGDDLVSAANRLLNGNVWQSSMLVHGGSGYDRIVISGQVNVDAGADDDIVGLSLNEAYASATINDTIDGGGGRDVVSVQSELYGIDATVLHAQSAGNGTQQEASLQLHAHDGMASTNLDLFNVENVRLTDRADTLKVYDLGDVDDRPLSTMAFDLGRSDEGRGDPLHLDPKSLAHFDDDMLDFSQAGFSAQVETPYNLEHPSETAHWGVRVNLSDTAHQTVQLYKNNAPGVGYALAAFSNLQLAMVARNANSVTGTAYDDILIGNGGKLEDGEGYSTLHGGGGNDFLAGRGWESHLFGDAGKDEFSVGSNTWVEDGEVGDTVDWGIRLTGGVNQWWQESGDAYWAPFSSLTAAFPVIGSELLYTAAFFVDQVTMKFARYRMTADGTLEINLWGQTASAAIKNYSLDLNSGVGTAGITVFSAGHGTSTATLGKNAEQSPFIRYVNLALKAGFGVGLHGVDPLVLDLNGDGYNLVAQSVSGVHFEFDNDGFGERTGWVRPTDGFLVRDANANGKIDNVTEMFGNASANGFDVLAGYDDNLDGAITSADSVYAQLQVWQDANQNGVTDAGELKSLAALGIVSISLAHAAPTDPTSIGGNAITHIGSFTRSDGSIGHVANVVLDTDETDSKWQGDATVDSVAATLPELAGSGELRDLRIAMSHDSTLETSVAAFVASTSADLGTLKAAAEQILYRWAGVDGVAATAIGGDGFDARKLAFLEKASGYELMPRDGNGVIALDNLDEVERLWSDQLTRLTLRLVVQGPMADAFSGLAYRDDLDLLVANSPNALADLLHNIIEDLPADAAAAAAQWSDWAPLLGAVSEGMVRSDGNVVRSDYLFAQLLRAADGVAQPLSLQQLADGLHIADVRIGTSANDILARGTAGETAIYYGDGGDDTFNGGTGQDVYVFGHEIGHATINDVEPNPAGDRIRFAFLSQDDVTMARDGNDLLITVTATGETIRVTGQFAPVVPMGSDVLLSSDKGIEDIQFADGSIMEIPEIMAAVGKGTDGDDHLVGTMHSDVLTAGKGDDLVEGGDDADLYVFNRGDGNDIYHDQQTTPLLRAADLVVFGDGIAPGDLTYTRTGANGDDLLITVANGGGSITIQGQFAYTSLGYNAALAPNSRIEAFAFRNYGDAFSNRDLQQQLIAQDTTDGNDVTRGFGDDDTFVASAGDDVLIGMDGADTYDWGAGAGNDTIREQAQYIDVNVGLGGISLTVRADVVQFDPSISPSSLIFSRNYDTDDLVITNTNTGETLTIDGQFNSFQTGVLGPQWFDRVEWFAFADNSAYSWQDVEAMVTTGSSGNDRLRGDILADRMVGGTGDDLLSGGGGGDTYVFNAGDGHDTVFDDNWTLIGDGFLTADQTIDTVQLGEGIDPQEVVFSRNGSSITLTFGNSGDAITLQGQDDYVQTGVFGAIPTSRIERVVFHDGTTWTWQDINQKMIAAQTTAGDDVTEGFTFADRFEKSAGDDILRGGESGDTYVFGVGAGHDRIEESVSNVLYGDDDSVEFDNTVAVADVSVARDGNDLILSLASGDSLRVAGEFELQTLYTWRDVENFRFADGTVWSKADIQRKLLQSTSGDDHLVGFYSSDDLDGGAGNDILEGGDGSDTYHFDRGYGNDEIRESVTEVNVGDFDQVVFGPTLLPEDLNITRDGNDLLLTVTDTGETLRVAGQFNFGSWFAWNDVELFKFANGTQWTDLDVAARLTGGTSGDDHLIGTFRSDTLDGKEGNDLLEGADGSDIYLFGRGYGHDEIRESLTDANLGEDDEVRFGAGITLADLGFTRNGDNLVISIAGTDDTLTLTGEFTYSFPYTWNDVERFTFADGSFITKGQVSQMVLAGTAGNDHIIGFGSDDTLDGGAGDDVLEGMDGSDTYRFGVGDGHDTVYETLTDGRSTEFDTLAFKDGVLPSDVTVARDGQDAIFTLASGDSIRVVGEFNPGYNELLRSNDVEQVTFSDGTIWSKADVQRKLLQSTSGDDHLVGFYTSDDLDGGAGNDLLKGGDGSDTYHFDRGYGNDEIRENVTDVNAGDFDQVVFGPTLLPEDLTVTRDGNDLLLTVADTGETLRVTGQFNFGSWFAWNDVELFKFANGTQWTDLDIAARLTGGTSGDDHLIGTFRSDTLDGKEGNDLLEGGDGSDIYLFGRGYGHDEIRESLTDANLGEDDEVRFGAGITLADLGFTRNGDNLVISIAGTDDTLTLTGEFTYSFPYTWNDVERFTFADGSFITKADISQMVLAGTPGNDHIIGFGSSDTLDGGAGDDVLEGLDGSDTYRFGVGDGHDTVMEILTDGRSSEFDTLAFKDGVLPGDVTVTRDGQDAVFTLSSGDTIRVVGQFNYGYNEFLSFNDIEQATFADGTVWSKADILLKVLQGTPGDDILIGGPGSDVLDGGAGNDRLEGSEGSDTYVWGTGYGNDTIHETFDLILRPEDDRLNIKGVDPDDLVIARSGNDIILTIPSGETLTIEGQLFDGRHDIDEFAFDDGTVWDLGTINAQILLQQATPGNDSIDGFGGDDYLFGAGGNDDLNGNEGNDVLDGGAGDDLLRGDIGNDTYRFGIGGGHDTIDDHRNGWAMGDDTIEFGAGIAKSDVAVTRDGSDLLLTITATGDSIRISGGAVEIGAVSREIEHVHFADGSSWTSAELRAFALGATTGDDSILGSDAAEPIDGLAGNDLIEARGGNDIVIGGAGDDTLAGEDGDDTYRYALGDGDDVINDNIHGWGGYHGFDTVDFAAGIDPADIRISVQNGDFLVSFAGAPGSLRLVGSASQNNSAIERMTFADGTIWTYAEMVTRSLVASNAANSLYGGNYDDVINGLAGDDFINGRGGNDDMTGGTGDDVMAGQGGDDTYRYALGDGDDVINDNIEGNNGNQGFDTLLLGAGITVANTEVTVSSNGRDFKLSFDGGSGSVTLTGTAAQSSESVDQVVFADGTVWTYADLQGRVVTNPAVVVGTNRNDNLYGGDGAQTLIGKQGNDTLEGRNGDDEYRYASGDGNDWINEQGSVGDVDTLKLSDLNPADITLSRDGVHLYVNVTATGQRIGVNNQFWDGHPEYGIEQIVFADGTTWDRNRISRDAPVVGGNGDDGLYGTSLDDTLIGHAGNDYLEGRGGSDTYRYASGDGFDTIRDNGAASDVDVLALNDLNPGQVELRREGNELYIRDIGAGKDIHVIGQFQTDGTAGLERLSFADGIVWNREAIRQHAWIQGWYLNQPGNESLYGSDLDDTLAGHGGNDYLEGRWGSDTYRYASGDGFDTIRDNGAASDADVLALSDLNPGQVELRREGDDLYVLDIGAGKDIRVIGQFQADGTAGLEQMSFADGTVWNRETIRQHAWIQGWYLNQPGNENLYGSGLDDTLAGHGGDDYLEGRDGSDTYRYASGDGNDRIYENGNVANIDVLELTDLSPADVVLRRQGGDLYVADIATGQQIRVQNQFYSDQQYAIEQIRFADGTVWDRARIAVEVGAIHGTSGSDTLIGTAAGDSLYGAAGADMIDGAAGDDFVDGGEGGDTLFGGAGNDQIAGGAGDDVIDGDGPVATGANLIVNGSFEIGTVVGGGGWGNSVSNMTGWTKANSQNYEQVYSGYAGVTATDGSFWLDMDSGGGGGSNMDISQTVSGLTAGDTMALSFDHANYTSAGSGAFEVYWNGTLITTINQTGTTMTTTTIAVTALGGDNVVRFKGIGPEDSGGATLDNVQLHATLPSNPAGGDDILTGGAGNDVLDGDGGIDIAVYSGASADYAVTANGDGSYMIADLTADRDGTDTLKGVETLRFSDGDFAPLDLSGGGQQALRSSSFGAPGEAFLATGQSSTDQQALEAPGHALSWIDDWSFDDGAAGRFGKLDYQLHRAFDRPLRVLAIDTLSPDRPARTSISASASMLAQDMASFAASSAGEIAGGRGAEPSKSDLWVARHRDGVGPVHPFEIAA